MVRLVLVDDHEVVRRGLQTYLESFDDIEVVGIVGSGEELLTRLEEWLPDIVVMDLLMPGGMNGIAATEQVREMAPNTRVVVLTAYDDDARVVAALRAGAIGYVKKDNSLDVLLDAIRAAAQGRSLLDPTIVGKVLHDLAGNTPGSDLTEREHEVLTLLAHGLTNPEIAAKLIISEETVKTHVGNILTKLQMAHRLQAVISALKRGLLDLGDIDLP